jgi:hypothetical protein
MNRFWKAVLLTTLVAGTLDIIAAHIHWTVRAGSWPTKMFYGIASGAIGREKAYNSGSIILLLGVFIHYFISFSFTLFYYLLYPAISRVSANKYINGILYAVFVWLMMNFIVLPLTAIPRTPFVFDLNKAIGIAVLIVVFGIPISIMADNYYKKKMLRMGGNSGQQAGLAQG